MTRTLIIGDVHGCFDELEALLDAVGLRGDDVVVFAGDLVHRGPDSAGVVRRARALCASHPGSACVLGNHEAKVLRRRSAGVDEPFFAALDADDWAFLAAMPLVWPLPGHDALVVHGGFDPLWLQRHDPRRIPADWSALPSRQRRSLERVIYVRNVAPDGRMLGLHEQVEGRAHWSAGYDGGHGFVFFGHAAQLSGEPLRGPHALGLDTACCFGGRLTAAVLEPGQPAAAARLVSVPARQAYASLTWLDDDGA